MATNILNLRIYTPSNLIIDEVITKITLYGDEGAFTILPRHIDYLSSFKDTLLYFTKENGEVVFVGVNQGILIKSGREIQITTFNAVVGGGSLDDLKEELKNNIDKKDFKNKMEMSLKNIEKNLFNDFKKF